MRTSIAMLLALFCTSSATAADWKTTSSTDGNFRAQFPSKPMTLNRTLNTAVGKIKLYMFIATAQSGKAAYAVMYNDYPAAATQNAKPNTILENALRGSIRSKRGKIQEKKNLKLDGYPGKQVKFVGTSNGQKLTGYIRVYLVKSRLYQVFVFGQSGGKLPEADVNKFFTSFKRLKK